MRAVLTAREQRDLTSPWRLATQWDTASDWVIRDIEQRVDRIDRYQNYVTPGELSKWRAQALARLESIRDDPGSNPNDQRRAYDLYRRLDKMPL